MLCERCKKKEAHVKIVAHVDGEIKSMNLCEDCAKAFQADNNNVPEELSKMIFNMLNAAFKKDKERLNGEDESLDDSLYTELFLKALKEAKKASAELKSGSVGTEHLLLGLLRLKEGLAYEILTLNGITEEMVLSAVRKYLDSANHVRDYEGSEYSPMCLQLFKIALELSREYKRERCGTEFLLMAFYKKPNCSAVRLIYTMLGERAPKVYKDLEGALGSGNVPRDAENSAKETLRPTRTPNLDQHSRDLSRMAMEGKLDPVIGRQAEIDRLIQILLRRTKNNPCLIGEPGVGKTAVVEGLALRIAEGNVPELMLNKRIVSLDLTSMVAGTKYRGEFEERIKNVIAEVANDHSIILFIDELHTIIGAGGAEGSLDAANIIKPALSRGELQLVGATTITEYRKHIEKDAALERRFQPVMVEEPTEEESLSILKGLRPRYEEHHQVKITDEALKECVYLSKRYIQDRFLPDKAIDLMDEASSKIRLATYKTPKAEKDLLAKLNALETEYEEVVLSGNAEEARKIRAKKKRAEKRLEALKLEKEQAKTDERAVVTAEVIQDIISTWTRIPVKTLKESDAARLRNLENTLKQRIISQQEAVTSVAKAVRRGRVGLKDPKRPIGSFLFLGPTGVGKTELTKALSEAVFGSEKAMIRLDMSEYMEKHSVSKMVGSPPGYVGFEEGGQLSELVRRNPYSVLLFDEIEKADPDVFNILLQVLDDGVITDSQGRKVDFKNTIIIMTSNLGAETIVSPKNLGFGSFSDANEDYNRMKERVLEVVKKTFKPEFLNRIDEMIVFHPLDKTNMGDICDIMLRELKERVKETLGLKLLFTPKAKAFLIDKGYDPKFGARPLRRAIQTYAEDGLSDCLLDNCFRKGDSITVTADRNNLIFKKK